MKQRRTFLASASALLAASVLSAGVVQAEPTVDQLTIVVGFPAGGASDMVARLVGAGMQGKYARNVIIDNRPGAGGRIAAEYVKDRPADGRWMLFTPTFPMNIFPHIYDDMRYDTLTDFTPVAQVSYNVLAVSVGPAVPESVTNINELLQWLRDNPDQANFGAPAGSGQHFTGLRLAQAADIDLSLISYQGGAPSITDAMGGHVPMVISALPEVRPHHDAGRMRILAITARERTDLLPDIPTLYESGFEEVVTQDWMGFLAPANLPEDILRKANEAINAAVASPQVQQGLANITSFAYTSSPEEFAETIRDSWETYRDVVAASGFKADQ